MFRDAESIIQDGLQLPPADRARIANRLYESLPEEDEVFVRNAWLTEAKQRLDEYRRGEGMSLTREESMAKARRMIEDSKHTRT